MDAQKASESSPTHCLLIPWCCISCSLAWIFWTKHFPQIEQMYGFSPGSTNWSFNVLESSAGTPEPGIASYFSDPDIPTILESTKNAATNPCEATCAFSSCSCREISCCTSYRRISLRPCAFCDGAAKKTTSSTEMAGYGVLWFTRAK